MSEHLNLTADEVLTTTRSVRKRLDFDRAVSRELITECLDLAMQAPTGSNRQGWQWMVVADTDKKKAIADYYADSFATYAAGPGAEYTAGDIRGQRMEKVRTSAQYLADNFHRSPFMVIPLIEGRPDNYPVMAQAGLWGSILPAVWSFMLALRERGLGSAWTTLHLQYEAEVAELLGIPHDRYVQAGLFPVAYTLGTEFKAAARIGATELTHWDSFG